MCIGWKWKNIDLRFMFKSHIKFSWFRSKESMLREMLVHLELNEPSFGKVSELLSRTQREEGNTFIESIVIDHWMTNLHSFLRDEHDWNVVHVSN